MVSVRSHSRINLQFTGLIAVSHNPEDTWGHTPQVWGDLPWQGALPADSPVAGYYSGYVRPASCE